MCSRYNRSRHKLQKNWCEFRLDYTIFQYSLPYLYQKLMAIWRKKLYHIVAGFHLLYDHGSAITYDGLVVCDSDQNFPYVKTVFLIRLRMNCAVFRCGCCCIGIKLIYSTFSAVFALVNHSCIFFWSTKFTLGYIEWKTFLHSFTLT